MGSPREHSFTARYGCLVHQLVTVVRVSRAFDLAVTEDPPPFHSYGAIWDTGCTNSGLTRRVAEECGLEPTSVVQAHTSCGVEELRVYSVNFAIGDNTHGIQIADVAAAEVSISSEAGADVLMGMNVILKGDFAVTNEDGKTALSFRVPSCEHIDFRCCGEPDLGGAGCVRADAIKRS